MKRIRRGDEVLVRTGRSKGQIGPVLEVIGDTVIVKGANLVTKHEKANAQTGSKGGITTREAPLHVSKVAHYDSDTQKAGKVGFKYEEGGLKIRYFKSTGKKIITPAFN